MTKTSKRIKLIYKPFLIIAFCTIAGYTFLNWLLFKKLHLFSLDEDVINFWIPFVLPWIPLLVWLRPRIKMLNLKRKKGDLPTLYIIIAGFAMIAPLAVSQSYIETASGELTRLDNIGHFKTVAATKYYTLKNFYLDKRNIGVQTVFDVSGKYNSNFNMSLYVVLPILRSPSDTLLSDCFAWYGVKYRKQISNRLSEKEKEDAFQKFASESQSAFDKRDVNQFVYFNRVGNTSDHKAYVSAIKNNPKYTSNSTVVMLPVNEPFESRNGNKAFWIFGSFVIGAAIWLLMILLPKWNDNATQDLAVGMTPNKTTAKEELRFLLPRKGFYITPVIMYLNIFVFILMVLAGIGFLSFNAEDLLQWGANFKPLTTDGEPWRLLTSFFLHGGIMHLLANMYGLLFVGIFLESRIGSIKYAVAYLIAGVAASMASLWWHNTTVSVGASGAIFGLYGVFLALLLTNVFPKEVRKPFLTSTLIFVFYNLVMGFAGTGIDNAAHIGGLLSGLVIGLFLRLQIKRQNEDETALETIRAKSLDEAVEQEK